MKLNLKDGIIGIKTNKGFTLIEVLIVLVLIAVLLVPTINALSVTNRVWSHTDAINPRIAQANTAMMWISRDIRVATQLDKEEPAAAIKDEGQTLVIYRYQNSKWQKIFYQVSNHKLNRFVYSNTQPEIVKDYILNGTEAWETLAEGVTSKPVFVRQVRQEDNPKTTIEINLEISDTQNLNKPRYAPFNVASAYTIRTNEVGAITGDPIIAEPKPVEVKVHKLSINIKPNLLNNKILEIKETNRNPHSISATVWPANATNKSVTWTSSKPDLVKINDANNLSTSVTVIRKLDFWSEGVIEDVTITVTPADPNGTSDSCKVRVTI